MKSAFGVDHGLVQKSFIPGKGYVKAAELDQFGRYGLKLATKKKAAANAGTIPGLGKTSGVGPQKLNRSPYFARQAKKEAVRNSRLHSGKKVSDVKYRGPR